MTTRYFISATALGLAVLVGLGLALTIPVLRTVLIGLVMLAALGFASFVVGMTLLVLFNVEDK
jgi:hypothetical protein